VRSGQLANDSEVTSQHVVTLWLATSGPDLGMRPARVVVNNLRGAVTMKNNFLSDVMNLARIVKITNGV
jgi:hypothetical protein